MQAALAPRAALLRHCGAPARVQPFRAAGLGCTRAGSRASRRQQRRGLAARAALSDSDDPATPQGLQAVQELDALIDALMRQKNPQDLAKTVAGGCSLITVLLPPPPQAALALGACASSAGSALNPPPPPATNPRPQRTS